MKPLVYKKSRREQRRTAPIRHKMHVAKGDVVRVISGEHRGKEGKILHVYPRSFRGAGKGWNRSKSTKRARPPRGKGGTLECRGLLRGSKVMQLALKRAPPGGGT